MKYHVVATSLILAIAAPAAAEVRVELPSATARQAADVASWATAIGAAALDANTSWHCADRARCFELQATRIGLTYSLVFAAKLLVHRVRPCAPACGADNPNFSFFSGHTALAFSSSGGARLSVTVPLAVSTGALRVAAGKHWISDVLVGAGVGSVVSLVR